MPFLTYAGEEDNGLSDIPDFNTIKNSIGKTLITPT